MLLATVLSADTWAGDVSLLGALAEASGLDAVRASTGRLHLRITAGGETRTTTVDLAESGDRPPLEAIERAASRLAPLELPGDGSGPVSFEARFTGVGFENDDGLLAGEAIDLLVHASVEPGERAYGLRVSASVRAGAVYADPVFVEVTGAPIRLEFTGEWAPATARLALSNLVLEHPGVGSVEASLVAVGAGLVPETWSFTLAPAPARALFETYLSPLLVGRWGKVSVEGDATLQGDRRRDGSTSLTLDVDSASVEAGAHGLGLAGLDGRVRWSDGGSPSTSRVAWRAIRAGVLELGAGELTGTFEGDRFALAGPLALEALGGRLLIEDLAGRAQWSGAPTWQMRAALDPMPVDRLGAAFDWPEIGGELHGVFPEVRYTRGELRIAGALEARTLGGRFSVRDVTVRRPLGPGTEIAANVDMDSISLERLTEAVPRLGTASGRLTGRVHGLRLVDGEPVAFDARFETDPDGRSTHRVSMELVGFLAALGGAGSRAIPSGVLPRVLGGFTYRRFAIGCRLRNGVCLMSGLGSRAGGRGYAIIEGGWLPTAINVVGYPTRVDWEALRRRLVVPMVR